VHPPNRGFGKAPRQSSDGDGRRPLLQGHLKRAKGAKATKPVLEQQPRPDPPKVPEED